MSDHCRRCQIEVELVSWIDPYTHECDRCLMGEKLMAWERITQLYPEHTPEHAEADAKYDAIKAELEQYNRLTREMRHG